MDSRSIFPGLRVSRRFARLVLAVVLSLPVHAALAGSSTPRLNAQESQPTSEDSARPASLRAESPSQEAGKSDAQETEATDALRHSSPVRWIAQKTGLSLDQAYWLCVLINFAIVVAALARPLRTKLPGLFKGRTQTIQSGIEEARKTSEEARRRLTEVEGRLSRLDVEITEMRREAQENALAEEKRILAETEQERRRIVASAEQEIALASAAARRDLKSYAAGLAVDLAEKKIHVGKDTDQALVREFTGQLGKDEL
ncbi:MAG TPA: ATP synthase F0 subunit B [Candidatus Angelobacter sp.]